MCVFALIPLYKWAFPFQFHTYYGYSTNNAYTIFILIENSCHFPNILKNGYLVSIHKSSDTFDVNYRLIVIMTVIAKIFKGLVLDVLSFTFKNVIIPEQHVFVLDQSLSFQSNLNNIDHGFGLCFSARGG